MRSNQINELLDLMLEYTKLGSNLPPSEMADIDIVEVLREVVASNYTDIEEAGMEVEFNFPEDQMICRMNKLEISRALNNLIANAIRHNPPGTKIVVELKIVKGNIIITIADTGSSIPLHLKKDLFKPFVLGDDSRSKGGSGLGLAIVDKLIMRNNGSISLEDGGNEFTKCFVINLKDGFGKK
ncbi:Sensor protein DivL [compost metagenome]